MASARRSKDAFRKGDDVILVTATDGTAFHIVVTGNDVHALAFVLGDFHCILEGRSDISEDGRNKGGSGEDNGA